MTFLEQFPALILRADIFELSKYASIARKVRYISRMIAKGKPVEKVITKAKQLKIPQSKLDEIIERAFVYKGMQQYNIAKARGLLKPRHTLETHVGDVARYSTALAKRLGVPKPRTLGRAAMLHDIGRPVQILGDGRHGHAGKEIIEHWSKNIAKYEKALGGGIKRTRKFTQLAKDITSAHDVKNLKGLKGPRQAERAITRMSDEFADLMKRNISSMSEFPQLFQSISGRIMARQKIAGPFAEKFRYALEKYRSQIQPAFMGGVSLPIFKNIIKQEPEMVSRLIRQTF